MRLVHSVFLIQFMAIAAFGDTPAETRQGVTAYALDPQHTHVVWHVDRFGFSKTYGSFTRVEGELTYDTARPDASEVSASITVGSLRSDLEEREQIVVGEHWLDAGSYSTIEFTADDVAVDASPSCENTCLVVNGHMTLRGVTAPLRLDVVLNKAGVDPVSRGPALGFSAAD